MSQATLFAPRSFDDKQAYGLEAQGAVARYLSKSLMVYKGDHPEGGPRYRDEQGLPIPDLLTLSRGNGPQLVEVKSAPEWFQPGGTKGHLVTGMEVAKIKAYAAFSKANRIPLDIIFAMRVIPNGVSPRGYPTRGHAGCYVATIEELVGCLDLPAVSLGRDAWQMVKWGVNLARRCDGGPLDPIWPWDEAAKEVPTSEAAWAAWEANEPPHERSAAARLRYPRT